MSFEQVQPISTQIDARSEADPEECTAISLAIDGDASGIDWLITRYRARAVRLAMHILGQSGEAEDAAQEAFIRAFRSLNSYKRDGKFYTWLYRIVVNVCLDRQRLARWDTEVDIASLPERGPLIDPAYEDVDLRIVVERLLAQLTPADAGDAGAEG